MTFEIQTYKTFLLVEKLKVKFC